MLAATGSRFLRQKLNTISSRVRQPARVTAGDPVCRFPGYPPALVKYKIGLEFVGNARQRFSQYFQVRLVGDAIGQPDIKAGAFLPERIVLSPCMKKVKTRGFMLKYAGCAVALVRVQIYYQNPRRQSAIEQDSWRPRAWSLKQQKPSPRLAKAW
jgi:hypothetical protein